MGSSRLPGKILHEIGGQTALQHVLDRCRAIRGIDLVVCAVPDEAASDQIEQIADRCSVVTFRGPEKNVLDRYLGAAKAVNADVIMRVTSDCPLIDPDICANVLALLTRSNADYACNNMPRSFPHGLDCEAFTSSVLEFAAAEASEPGDYEHVTPWLRRSSQIRRENFSSGNSELASNRWTLDYPEDLEFFRALSRVCPGFSTARMEEILVALKRYPEIVSINRDRHSD
jgi:spore coat polysaccharide biosynthesis protein SpsF (cytidylyltransferase family)